MLNCTLSHVFRRGRRRCGRSWSRFHRQKIKIPEVSSGSSSSSSSSRWDSSIGSSVKRLVGRGRIASVTQQFGQMSGTARWWGAGWGRMSQSGSTVSSLNRWAQDNVKTVESKTNRQNKQKRPRPRPRKKKKKEVPERQLNTNRLIKKR